MPKINFATGKPLPSLSSEELDRLLNSATDSVSATDSRGAYQNEWKRKHKDTIRFDAPKGTKDFLQKEACLRGMSMTKLIKQAIVMYIGQSNDKSHPIGLD